MLKGQLSSYLNTTKDTLLHQVKTAGQVFLPQEPFSIVLKKD